METKSLVVLFLLIIIVLLYKSSYKSSYNSTNDKVLVYRFFKPSCPYCVNSQDEWEKFKKLPNDKIITIDIDTTNPTLKEKELSENFSKKTVPFYICTFADGRRYVYDGDRSSEDLNKWINSLL